MRKIVFLATMAMLLVGCNKQESIEDRAAREAQTYTRRMCPEKLNEFTRLDSITFDRATLTVTQHLTLLGNADNLEVATAKSDEIRKELVAGVKADTSNKLFKDHGFRYRFLARSESDSKIVLYDTTVTPEDYK